MKTKFPLLPLASILAISALGFLAACTTALECGTWNFTGTPAGDAFPLTSAFTFTPSDCGKNCRCEKDVMIQMAVAFGDDGYIYPSSSYADRATSNGWSIDRIDGEGYGYYALINDGKTFFPGWNTPGANGTANTLIDEPGGFPPNSYMYAVDAATCFGTDMCQNKILGYYFWSWYIDSSYNGQKFIIAPAWTGMDTEFQNAVAAWNTWAPTSGTEGGSSYAGDFTSLPHAVLFPALSDL